MSFFNARFLSDLREKLIATFPGATNSTGSSGDSRQARGEMVEQTRSLGSFTGLVVDIPAVVTVRRGHEPSATVLAQSDLQDKILTQSRGGKLVISAKAPFSARHPISIEVVADQPLDCADISGSGKIDLGELSGDARIQMSGAAQVRGHGSLREVSIEQEGGGKLFLSGVAERVVLEQSGAGKADLEHLKAARVRLDISGAGRAVVHASEVLAADISGAGQLRVLGNPERHSIDKTGPASVSFG